MWNRVKIFHLIFAVCTFNISYAADNGFINFGECSDCGEIYCKELDYHKCNNENDQVANNDLDNNENPQND